MSGGMGAPPQLPTGAEMEGDVDRAVFLCSCMENSCHVRDERVLMLEKVGLALTRHARQLVSGLVRTHVSTVPVRSVT